MQNIDSFQDEQLLNLLNNTILTKTKYKLADYSGAYSSISLNANKTQITYKIALLFGYHNRNSRSVVIEIQEELVYIWLKAIHLKAKSMKINNTGMSINELNALLNTPSYDGRTTKNNDDSYEHRTNVHCNTTTTNYPNIRVEIFAQSEKFSTLILGKYEKKEIRYQERTCKIIEFGKKHQTINMACQFFGTQEIEIISFPNYDEKKIEMVIKELLIE